MCAQCAVLHNYRVATWWTAVKLTQQVMKELDNAVKEYLARMASAGGKARAAKYDKATLSRWSKLGGRPRKGAKKGKTK